MISKRIWNNNSAVSPKFRAKEGLGDVQEVKLDFYFFCFVIIAVINKSYLVNVTATFRKLWQIFPFKPLLCALVALLWVEPPSACSGTSKCTVAKCYYKYKRVQSLLWKQNHALWPAGKRKPKFELFYPYFLVPSQYWVLWLSSLIERYGKPVFERLKRLDLTAERRSWRTFHIWIVSLTTTFILIRLG